MSNDQRQPVRFTQPPLQSMTPKDADEYMRKLATTNGAGLSGVEAQVEASLRTAAAQRQQVNQKLKELSAQVDQLVHNDKELAGQMHAFSYILQKTEDNRRWEAATNDPIAKLTLANSKGPDEETP